MTPEEKLALLRSLPGLQVLPRRANGDLVEVYAYLRRNRAKVDGDTEAEIRRSYSLAQQAMPPAIVGKTFGDLLEEYRRAPEFHRLDPWTRYTKERVLLHIDGVFGPLPLEEMQDELRIADIYAYRDAMSAAPAMADQRVRTLRQVIDWAIGRRAMGVNRARGIARLVERQPDRSRITWSYDDQAAFLAAASPAVRTLFLASLYSAARRGDVIAWTWAQYRDGWLTYTPQKTERTTAAVVELPVYALPAFAELLDELPRDREFILVGPSGKPWTGGNAVHRFNEVRAKALPGRDLHLHDLRGTAISRMLASGCTEAEVATISGHKIGGKTMLGRYARPERDAAVHAFEKWHAHDFTGRGKVVRLRGVGNA